MKRRSVSSINVDINKEDILEALTLDKFKDIEAALAAKVAQHTAADSRLQKIIKEVDAEASRLRTLTAKTAARDVIAQLDNVGLPARPLFKGVSIDYAHRLITGRLHLQFVDSGADWPTSVRLSCPFSDVLIDALALMSKAKADLAELKRECDELSDKCDADVQRAYTEELKVQLVKNAMVLANGEMKKLLAAPVN